MTVAHLLIALPVGALLPATVRLVDLLFAGTALLLGLPMLVAIGLAITLTSPGPVFSRHERIGLHGRPFMMIRFRTVVEIHDDPRLTPLGRVLRTYRLDELPQLINVLKGDMSVVGPHPLSAGEVDTHAGCHQTSRRPTLR